MCSKREWSYISRNIEKKIDEWDFYETEDKDGNTPLFMAIKFNNLSIVKLLFKAVPYNKVVNRFGYMLNACCHVWKFRYCKVFN